MTTFYKSLGLLERNIEDTFEVIMRDAPQSENFEAKCLRRMLVVDLANTAMPQELLIGEELFVKENPLEVSKTAWIVEAKHG